MAERGYAELVKDLRCHAGTCEYKEKECSRYNKRFDDTNYTTCSEELCDDTADAIEELLAKVPKHGEWLPHQNPQFVEVDVCSVCGFGTRKMYHCTDGVQTWDEKPFFRYCPWCGAKMKGVSEDGD